MTDWDTIDKVIFWLTGALMLPVVIGLPKDRLVAGIAGWIVGMILLYFYIGC